ncbi:hypothetical protein BDW59DRAFT_157231 [Aspergillus cavernicola]|uniref:Uncharacterized protein n=1 Tax=Aspergillus cavernicola TaxID=176166 RepID=A0ABR4IXA2_9EURO
MPPRTANEEVVENTKKLGSSIHAPDATTAHVSYFSVKDAEIARWGLNRANKEVQEDLDKCIEVKELRICAGFNATYTGSSACVPGLYTKDNRLSDWAFLEIYDTVWKKNSVLLSLDNGIAKCEGALNSQPAFAMEFLRVFNGMIDSERIHYNQGQPFQATKGITEEWIICEGDWGIEETVQGISCVAGESGSFLINTKGLICR